METGRHLTDEVISEVHLTLARHVLGAIPEYERYASSADVAQECSDLAEEFRDSKAVHVQLEPFQAEATDEPINALIIEPAGLSEEERAALPTAIFQGNSHSDELLWTKTIPFLARFLCENPWLLKLLGFRFVFFDGEPGSTDLVDDACFKEGATVFEILRGSTRSPAQIDWDYPLEVPDLHHKHESTSSGAKVGALLMKLYNPLFWMSMHDAILSSVTYVSRDFPELWPRIAALREALGLHSNSDCEFSNAQELAEGTYLIVGGEEVLREHVQNGGDPKMIRGGDISIHYHGLATSSDSLGIVEEVVRVIATYPAETAEALEKAHGQLLDGMTKVIARSKAIMQVVGDTAASTAFTAILQTGVERAASNLELQLAGWKTEPGSLPDLLQGSYQSLFNVGRLLGRAIRLAEALGHEEEVTAGDEVLHEIAHDIEEALQPVPVSIRTRMSMQIGAALLSILAIKTRREHPVNS